MVDVSFEVERMQLYMGGLLDEKLELEVKSLIKSARAGRLDHPRIILPISSFGQYGFRPIKTITHQAFTQQLAYEGCIASTLLFGHSLSEISPLSSRVICEINAFEYMYIGLEAILFCCNEVGFAKAFEYVASSSVLYDVCHYVLAKTTSSNYVADNPDVVKFAQLMCCGAKHTVKIDS